MLSRPHLGGICDLPAKGRDLDDEGAHRAISRPYMQSSAGLAAAQGNRMDLSTRQDDAEFCR